MANLTETVASFGLPSSDLNLEDHILIGTQNSDFVARPLASGKAARRPARAPDT
jgi:hypothetical protein